MPLVVKGMKVERQFEEEERELSNSQKALRFIEGVVTSDPLGIGPSPLAVGGLFRQVGLQRILGIQEQFAFGGKLIPKVEGVGEGIITAQRTLEILKEIPGFNRMQELVQKMIRRSLGESFEVFRGLGPFETLEGVLKSEATAVTLSRRTATFFSEEGSIISSKISPKDVIFIVPTRRGFPVERELIISSKALAGASTARILK